MKIAIPTDNNGGLDDTVAEHFGRCQTYTFLNEEGDVIETINNASEHTGGSGLPPELLKKHKVDILLCRDIGPRAINLCQELEIDVYVSQADTAKDFFMLWKNKKLKKAGGEDACEQHKI